MIQIQLSGKTAEVVNAKVAAGGYPNATAFISDIVFHADEFDRIKLKRLRQVVNIGLDEIRRGEVVEFDLGEILNEEVELWQKRS